MSLEFVTTDDLIDELLSRCKCGIVKLDDVAQSGEGSEPGCEWCVTRFKGHLTHCLGMTVEVQRFLADKQNGPL